MGARNDVNTILNKIDIFVFSTTKNEGFGIALVEAMGKGIPVVASNVGSCREILLRGKCGLLFKPKSPIAIANAIEKVLIYTQETKNRMTEAKKHASNNFTKKKMSELYYSELFLTNN